MMGAGWKYETWWDLSMCPRGGRCRGSHKDSSWGTKKIQSGGSEDVSYFCQFFGPVQKHSSEPKQPLLLQQATRVLSLGGFSKEALDWKHPGRCQIEGFADFG